MNLREQMAALTSAVKSIVDTAAAEGRGLTDDEVSTIEAKHAEHAELKGKAERAEKAADMVTKLVGEPGAKGADTGKHLHFSAPAADVDGKSLGERIATSGAFRKFREEHPSGVDGETPVRIKAKDVGSARDVFGAKATLVTGTGQPRNDVQPGYRDYTDPARNYPLSLLDLVTVGNTDSTSLEYRQVVTVTNNAAIVPEGELKPLSDLTTAAADAKVFTYADGFDATNQFLADEAALATFMEGAVRLNLRNRIEDLLLNGAGGAAAPRGILNTTGIQAQAFTTDVITTVAAALEKLAATNANPQAILVHPSQLWKLRLLKDTTGQYLAGGPFSAGAAPSLWGVPLVASYRLAPNTALIGNFSTVNFLEREGLSVLAFNQHRDYAQRNMVYVRAELRAMQLVYAPREIVRATLAAA